MSSLPKVIKPSKLIASEEIVQIPDAVPDLHDSAVDELLAVEDKIPPASQSRSILGETAIERANEVSRKILQSARIEREKILEQAQEEAAGIRETAQREAYRQVLEEKQAEITSCLEEMDQLMNQLREEQESFLQQYEEGLSDLAVEIAEKVLKDSVHKNKELLISLVKEAVSSVKNADWISVQISDKLPDLVEKLQGELSTRKDFMRVEVSTADLPVDSCIVHTPEGVIDASVPVQLDNLKTLFHHSDS